MNKVVLIGRLTRDVNTRHLQKEKQVAVARYILAIPRKCKHNNAPDFDFVNCVAYGKSAEFAQKNFFKGVRIAVVGHLQTDSYIEKDGIRVCITEIIVDEQ